MSDTWLLHTQFSDLGAPPTRESLTEDAYPYVQHGAVLGIFNDVGSGKVVRIKRLTLTEQTLCNQAGNSRVARSYARVLNLTACPGGQALSTIKLDSDSADLPPQVRVAKNLSVSAADFVSAEEPLRLGVYIRGNQVGTPTPLTDLLGRGHANSPTNKVSVGAWTSSDSLSPSLSEGQALVLGIAATAGLTNDVTGRMQVRVWLRVGAVSHLVSEVLLLDAASLYSEPYSPGPLHHLVIWNGTGSGVSVKIDRIEIESVYAYQTELTGRDLTNFTVETTGGMIGGRPLSPIPFDSGDSVLGLSGIQIKSTPVVQQFGPRLREAQSRPVRRTALPALGTGVNYTTNSGYAANLFGTGRDQHHLIDTARDHLALREGEGLALFDKSGNPYGDWTIDISFTVEAVESEEIESEESFGTPYVFSAFSPTSIPSEEAFGTPALVLVLQPTSIPSEEDFGAVEADLQVDQDDGGLDPGIESAEAFGTPTLLPILRPTSIASLEAFGPVVFPLLPPSIASLEAFGGASVLGAVRPETIPSAEAFGTAVVGPAIGPTSIASLEAFGTPTVAELVNPLVVSATAAQRDTDRTFLVDVDVTLHHPTDDAIGLEVEWGLAEEGPFEAATQQPYDRQNTTGGPPGNLMTPVPAVGPGATFRYVWAAFLDLDEGAFDVWLRLNVGGTYLVIGPVEVSTVVEVPDTPLERRLARRRAAARTPLDFLGNGLVAPFRRSSRDFASASGVDLVRSSVREILLTRAAHGRIAGDLPWRPDFGSKLWVLRHRGNDRTLEGQAMAFVREALRWEPRVLVTDVFVERDSRTPRNVLAVRVRYKVIDQDVPDNRVVLPEFEDSVPLG